MIVIVVGMHRSGTSAIAGILHLNGIVMGENSTFKPKPLPQNPKGFFENYMFRKINDRILELSKYDVKSFQPDIPEMISSKRLIRRARNLLHKYQEKYPNWGWKDPRTCLTLGTWLEGLSELDLLDYVRILVSIRNPESVADSLFRRNKVPYDNALRLWMKYNQSAMETIDRYKVKSLYFSFEQLINDPIRTMDSIFSYLGLEYSERKVLEFVDPKLAQSGLKSQPLHEDTFTIPGLKRFQEHLYSRLSE